MKTSNVHTITMVGAEGNVEELAQRRLRDAQCRQLPRRPLKAGEGHPLLVEYQIVSGTVAVTKITAIINGGWSVVFRPDRAEFNVMGQRTCYYLSPEVVKVIVAEIIEDEKQRHRPIPPSNPRHTRQHRADTLPKDGPLDTLDHFLTANANL